MSNAGLTTLRRLGSEMDQNKIAYFLQRYRAANQEEFADLLGRRDSLAEEAEAALAQICSERGIRVPDSSTAHEPSLKDRKIQTELSIELWKGPLSSRVKNQWAFLFAMPVVHITGSQGMKLGALVLIAAVIPAWYVGKQVGHNFTKAVCENSEKSIDEKRKHLRTASWLLWPGILATTLIAAVVLQFVRAT